VFLIIFSFAAIACGMAGLIVNKKLDNSLGTVGCSTISLLEEIIYGVTLYDGSYWLGMAPAFSKVENLEIQVNNSLSVIDSTFKEDYWMNKDIQSLKLKNAAIYDKFKDKNVSSPNPSSPSGSRVSSQFISNVLNIKT
jgi:hypothetical protein